MSEFFELNSAGVRAILQSEEMSTIIQEAASKVANTAGIGYEANVQTHNRVVGRVEAVTKAARRENQKSNTLLKALHD